MKLSKESIKKLKECKKDTAWLDEEKRRQKQLNEHKRD